MDFASSELLGEEIGLIERVVTRLKEKEISVRAKQDLILPGLDMNNPFALGLGAPANDSTRAPSKGASGRGPSLTRKEPSDGVAINRSPFAAWASDFAS